jgi:hypothetical protein
VIIEDSESLQKLGAIDVVVGEASFQIVDLFLYYQCVRRLLFLRARLELERMLLKDHFFALQASDERPHVGMSLVYTQKECLSSKEFTEAKGRIALL